MNRENSKPKREPESRYRIFWCQVAFEFSESNAEVNRKGDRMARAEDRVTYERSHQNETREAETEVQKRVV
jgi:hypothetical protein